MCKDRIEKAVKGVKGVLTANWNVESKMLEFDLDKDVTNQNVVSKAIAKAGHDTKFDKANQLTYSALPSCCLYVR